MMAKNGMKQWWRVATLGNGKEKKQLNLHNIKCSRIIKKMKDTQEHKKTQLKHYNNQLETRKTQNN